MVKYSNDKKQREKNLAAIRTAAIYSIMIAAFGISCMYSLGSFIAAFMMIGGVQLCLSPILYWKLMIAKDKYATLNMNEPDVNAIYSEEEKNKPSVSFSSIAGDKYTFLCLVSLMRYHTVYYYFLVLLSPMIVTYHAVTPEFSVLAYFVAPVMYLLFLPVVTWFINDFKFSQRTMIIIGQSLEAFGCMIVCGDVSALGYGYIIAMVGVGCAAMGISQCIV